MNRDSRKEEELTLEGVFIQIGLIPNTDWLKDDMEIKQVRRNRGQRSW